MAEVEAIILAGGYGSRFGDEFCYTQKCLLPIEGKPILGHILDNLIEAFGSVNTLIAVGHKADHVVEYISNNRPSKMNIAFIPGCNLGIPDAHLKIEPFVKDKFVTLPADVIIRPHAYVDVMELFERSAADAAVVLSSDVDEANTHSVAKLSGHQITEFSPAPAILDPDHLRNVTIYGADHRLFDLIRRSNPPENAGSAYQFIRLFDQINLSGFDYDEPWVHVAYQADLAKRLP